MPLPVEHERMLGGQMLCSQYRNIAQQERRDQERVSANADRTAAIEPRIVRAAGWGSAVDIKRGDNISPHSAAGTLGARGLEWGGGSCSTSQFVQTPLNSHLLACRTSAENISSTALTHAGLRESGKTIWLRDTTNTLDRHEPEARHERVGFSETNQCRLYHSRDSSPGTERTGSRITPRPAVRGPRL